MGLLLMVESTTHFSRLGRDTHSCACRRHHDGGKSNNSIFMQNFFLFFFFFFFFGSLLSALTAGTEFGLVGASKGKGRSWKVSTM